MVLDIMWEEIDELELELIYDRNIKKYECICGAIINKQSKKRHEASKRHTIYLNQLETKDSHWSHCV